MRLWLRHTIAADTIGNRGASGSPSRGGPTPPMMTGASALVADNGSEGEQRNGSDALSRANRQQRFRDRLQFQTGDFGDLAGKCPREGVSPHRSAEYGS